MINLNNNSNEMLSVNNQHTKNTTKTDNDNSARASGGGTAGLR